MMGPSIHFLNKRMKNKSTRKTSIVTLIYHEEAESSNSSIWTNKCRLSVGLVPITEENSEDLLLFESYNLQSNPNDNLSVLKELQGENIENDHSATEHVSKLKTYKNEFNQTLPINELSSFQKNRQVEFNLNLTLEEQLKLSKETNQKPVSLEEKLSNDHEWHILGIINLSSMHLTDSDMPLIIQKAFFEKKKKCIGLILRDNNMTSVGVRLLVDALVAERTKLKYLSFSNNSKIGDTGIEHLIHLFKIKRSVTFLALPNIGITDHGVRLLADLLCEVDADSRCPPIEKLYISFNKSITDESMTAMVQILERNRTLKLLSVEHCSFSGEVRQILKQVAAKRTKNNFHLIE